MRILSKLKPTTAAVIAVSLLGCGSGGGSSGGGPVATIVVPNAGAAEAPPGGQLSFEGSCSNATGPVTYSWAFPGGVPSTSAAEIPGVVAFVSAGSYEVSYSCTDGKGQTSAIARQTVVVEDAPPSLFAIRFQYLNGADAYQADFQWAADRISQIVLGPVPGFKADEPATSDCGGVAFSTDVGHLLILANTDSSLPGSTLADSSPCYVRTFDGLPFAGIVHINVNDIPTLQAAGTFRYVLLHEMLHVMGFGSLWGPPSANGFGLLTGGGSSDPYFTGAQARAAFRDFNGGGAYLGTPVPVENVGGDASRDWHWRKTEFGSELMTATLTSSTPALSRTTVESLADMGYQVNGAAADPFDASTAAAAAEVEGIPIEGL